MCKRLGFDGYSELYYHLSRQLTGTDKRTEDTLGSFVDNYQTSLSAASASCCARAERAKSLQPARAFPILSARISSSVCPSAASWPSATSTFTTIVIFQEAHQGADADENDIMFAVSQSGETEPVFKRRAARKAARAENYFLHAPQRFNARAALRSCLCRRRSEADAGGQSSESVFRAYHPDL